MLTLPGGEAQLMLGSTSHRHSLLCLCVLSVATQPPNAILQCLDLAHQPRHHLFVLHRLVFQRNLVIACVELGPRDCLFGQGLALQNLLFSKLFSHKRGRVREQMGLVNKVNKVGRSQRFTGA